MNSDLPFRSSGIQPRWLDRGKIEVFGDFLIRLPTRQLAFEDESQVKVTTQTAMFDLQI